MTAATSGYRWLPRAGRRRAAGVVMALAVCGGCAGSERAVDASAGPGSSSAATRPTTTLELPTTSSGASGTSPRVTVVPDAPVATVDDGSGLTTPATVTPTTLDTLPPTVEPVDLPGFPAPLLPARPGPLVVMVGDSLMWSATSELHDRFIASGAGETRIAAVAGSRLDDMVDLVGAGARADADVLVVALGTNDLRRGPADRRDDDTILSDTSASVGRVVGAARGARCVVWVTVGASTEFAGLGDRPDRFSALLPMALAPLGATVRIADWRSASAGHPDWFDWDGLHLSRSGQVAFAGVIADQAATCPTV